MDVLIKNMEKPTNCFTCILSEVSTDFGKLVCLRLGKDCNNTILEGCPLVELPPHGRLIDADAFIKNHKDGFKMNWDKNGCTIGTIQAPLAPVEEALDEAPTVLEAST